MSILDNERFGRNRPSHDPEVVRRLMEEDGYTEREALTIAVTEMEGSSHWEDGTLGARQTYCDSLREPEDLPRSRGARDGERACLKAIEEWRKSINK